VDFSQFEVATFDCYGTLIDWEAGILAELRPILVGHDFSLTDDDVLERYARFEAAIEGGPYRPYRDVLAASLVGMAADLGIEVTPDDLQKFSTSVRRWPPFADSAGALKRLASRYRLGVITNCDDDLFAASAERLETTFEWVVTAEQVGAYKPNPAGFERALALIGVPRERILHVAQSLFHDHVPAKALGMTTVWIDRRHDRPGSGATPPAEATPDLVVPDLETLATLTVGPAQEARGQAQRRSAGAAPQECLRVHRLPGTAAPPHLRRGAYPLRVEPLQPGRLRVRCGARAGPQQAAACGQAPRRGPGGLHRGPAPHRAHPRPG